MKKYRYYIAFVLIFLIGLGYSFYKSNEIRSVSYQDVYDQTKEIVVGEPYTSLIKGRSYYYTALYDNNIYESLDEIMNQADAVCLVSLVDTIQETRGAVKSSVKVEEVWKSDLEAGTTIDVFEQFFIDQDYRIITSGGVMPMQKDKHYLVFLNQYEEYENGKTYGFTSMLYDKFPVHEDVTVLNMRYSIYDEHSNTSLYREQWEAADIVHFQLDENLTYLKNSEDYEYMKDDVAAMEAYVQYQDTYMNILKEIYEKLDIPFTIKEVAATPFDKQ